MNLKELKSINLGGNTRRFLVSGPPNVFDSTQIAWTPGTYFDSWTSRSGIVDNTLQSIQADVSNLVWQLFFAHKAITLPVGSLMYGVNPKKTSSCTISLRAAISTADNTLGSFASDSQYATVVKSSVGGVLDEMAVDTLLTVPANRYFLLGVVITNGSYYRTLQTLSKSRTAIFNNENIVTCFNRVYHPGSVTGPLTGIPTLLGGSASFTLLSNVAAVTSFKFNMV